MRKTSKPKPDEILAELEEGNQRFVSGKMKHPHLDKARKAKAGKEDQGNHAYATILTCSDSRVPVELVFDAGVMDIFVVRVAGNVCKADEVGSIEYGLAHVHTPVLVVLGHTLCGAVTTVVGALQGKETVLETNIPQLVAPIIPAAERAIEEYVDDRVIPFAIEENVWQSIEDLFALSPATRTLVKEEKVKVVGAIYDIGTGIVKWLEHLKVNEILEGVEKTPEIEMNIHSTFSI
ncbi:MAG: Carbonic anhydrase 2 [Chloroflexi bacterium]|nr:Carbonic anhydrase 2 [Chloroflexota bacterium]